MPTHAEHAQRPMQFYHGLSSTWCARSASSLIRLCDDGVVNGKYGCNFIIDYAAVLGDVP
jgi:hypothetical protein